MVLVSTEHESVSEILACCRGWIIFRVIISSKGRGVVLILLTPNGLKILVISPRVPVVHYLLKLNQNKKPQTCKSACREYKHN